MSTKIEWTDETWNPIRARDKKTGRIGWHCEHVTEACRFCYAESMNAFRGTGLAFKPGLLDRLEIFLDEEMMDKPLHWRRPRKVFALSMTDLFADFVREEWISSIYDRMVECEHLTFQVLTKRPARMRHFVNGRYIDRLPPRNIWHGVSVCDQPDVDHFLPILGETWSRVRFVSAEPVLAHMDLTPHLPLIDQVITGGESGRFARPSDPDHFRAIREQCRYGGTAYFHKQNGEWLFFGKDYPGAKFEGHAIGWTVRTDSKTFHGATVRHVPEKGFYVRVGKDIAGRMLDGHTYSEFPR